MRIEKRTMGWIQKPSAYQYNQQLNAKRKAMAQNFIDQQAVLSSAIFSAQDNLTFGTVENAYRNVIQRAQEQAKAKMNDLADVGTSISKSV